MNVELALCAKINFENLERANPMVARDPYYQIAKAQLDEALGGIPVERKLASMTFQHINCTCPMCCPDKPYFSEPSQTDPTK